MRKIRRKKKTRPGVSVIWGGSEKTRKLRGGGEGNIIQDRGKKKKGKVPRFGS